MSSQGETDTFPSTANIPDVESSNSTLQTRESSVELVSKDDKAAEVGEEAATPVYYYGLRCWHPTWLQVLANPKFFTFLLCLHGLVEGALVSGFSSIVLSSVERRFKFNSTAVGFLLVSFDVSVLVCVIFISYFGDKRHKPRWLGYGLIFQGAGALVFALPEFLFGNYSAGAAGALTLESCTINPDEMFVSNCDSSNIIAYLIMLVGNVLIGIGAAPLFTLGLSYIDDITYPRYVPIHMGIFYTAVAIGPAIGYALGGVFLTVYVNPWVDTRLVESDPGWVGAWWICFIISSVLSFMLALPFLMFPRFLPNHSRVVKARRKQQAVVHISKYGDESSLKDQLQAFPGHLWELCKSLSFLCVTLALGALFLTLYGLVAFGPKFIESVFNIPASSASFLAGAVAIPAGGIGTIVGSLIVYFMKSDTKRVAMIPWLASIVALPALLGFFITCPTVQIAGINTIYANNSLDFDDAVLASCNYDCRCNSTLYEPVCGADGITYFSPCRAGCEKTFIDPDNPTFENCTCIMESLMSMHRQLNESGSVTEELDFLSNSTATPGKCPQECNTLGLWLLLIALVVFIIFLLRIPTLLITIRSVAEEQRSLALGVQSVLWRALGSIPGPLLFGAIFDSSCTYWQIDCGRRGNCWVYDNNTISIRAFFMSTTGVSINVVLMLLCWIFFPPVTCRKPSEKVGEGGGVNNKSFDEGEQVQAEEMEEVKKTRKED